MNKWVIAGLVGVITVVAASVVFAQSTRTSNVEVRVWQDVNNAESIYISARPEGGAWDTLGTIRLPLTDGVSSSGRYRYGDITVAVPPRPSYTVLRPELVQNELVIAHVTVWTNHHTRSHGTRYNWETMAEIFPLVTLDSGDTLHVYLTTVWGRDPTMTAHTEKLCSSEELQTRVRTELGCVEVEHHTNILSMWIEYQKSGSHSVLTYPCVKYIQEYSSPSSIRWACLPSE